MRNLTDKVEAILEKVGLANSPNSWNEEATKEPLKAILSLINSQRQEAVREFVDSLSSVETKDTSRYIHWKALIRARDRFIKTAGVLPKNKAER